MKIQWVSDSVNIPTGYAQVTRNILYRLKMSGFDVEHIGFHFTPTQPIPSSVPVNYPIKFPIMPTGQNHWEEFYGNKGTVETHASAFKPDILAFLCDSFMIKWILDEEFSKEFPQGRKKFDRLKEHAKKTLFYFPFDSRDVYDKAKDVIELFDIRVAMSRWGQEVLRKAGLESHYIPHGADTNIYRPLPQETRDALRKQNGFDGKFVIGCVAKNQTRKMLPNLMQAYKNLLDKYDDMILFIHCNPTDPQGWNLVDYAKRIGLENKVMFGLKANQYGLHECQVNMVYNTMDIHVLPTTGEGFGLPIIESMAAGIPNIATDYTTSRELLDGHGELIRLSKEMPYIIGQLNTHRALPSVPDMEKKIEKLYKRPKLREQYSKVGRRFVLDHYNWEKVLRQWTELLEYGKVKEPY